MIKPPSLENTLTATNKVSQKAEGLGKTNNVHWIMPSILAVALIVAGFLHYKAAQVARRQTHFYPKIATETQPVSPIISAPIVPLRDGRVMANATPSELVGLWEGHTTAQAEKLTESYIGTWLGVSGQAWDVDIESSGQSSRVSIDGVDGVMLVFCHFGAECKQQVSVLRKGNSISVFRQVSAIERSTVSLRECEFT
jgi:hypothetical protein